MRPVVTKLVERAQEAGVLREDFRPNDVPLIAYMLGAAAEYASHVAPEVLRRYLALIIDGLRPSRDGVSELPVPALTPQEMEQSMRAHGQGGQARRRPAPVTGRIAHSRTAAGCKCTCIRTFPYSCTMCVHSQFAEQINAIDRTNSLWHLTCGFANRRAAHQRTAYPLLPPSYRLANIAYIT